MLLLDYISVVVSGVLAKSRNLCKLQVRLCLADFDWTHEQILANTKLIVGPFERLRNVRQPQILGICMGKPNYNSMLTVQRPARSTGSQAPICSVPSLPTHTPLLIPGMPDFDAYSADWSRWISSNSNSPVTMKPPIRAMFTAFKDFYSELSSVVPQVTLIQGRHAFLHRARVAREQEDVKSFRYLRNELVQYWYAYLEQEERKKNDMNLRLSRMLDTDIYPSHEWEEPSTSCTRRSSSTVHESSQSPVALSAKTLVKEGIPMAANPRKRQQSIKTPQGHRMANAIENWTTTELDQEAYECRPTMQKPAPVDYQIDSVDVACYAHVNLSTDWFTDVGAPGPSTKKRRVESVSSDISMPADAPVIQSYDNAGDDISYVGKGKGKMGVEIICLD
jgi:hypothetical protein